MITRTEFATCAGCQTELTRSTREAHGGWSRSPGGDEYYDEIHRCSQCGEWSMLTFIDRFAGSDEIKVTGPLTGEEVQQQRQRLSG